MKTFFVIFSLVFLAACSQEVQEISQSSSEENKNVTVVDRVVETPITELEVVEGSQIEDLQDPAELESSYITQAEILSAEDGESIAMAKYEEFSEEAFTAAEKKVLFFHADWCPSCRWVDNDILEKFDELPAGATILKVDYDNSKELKDQYGVRSQHTFVFLDENNESLDVKRGLSFKQLVEAL